MKNIFRLAVKGIFVMLPMIIICIYTWINPLGFMTDGTPFDLWNKEMTGAEQDKDYEVIILGDSTANAAYVPEILSGGTINLSLGAITPMESYYILEEWLKHNTAPKACYISFLDYHLRDTNTFWNRTMYTHRFGCRQNLEMLKTALDYGGTSIVTEDYAKDFIAYELRLPNKYITSLMNAGFNQRYEENTEARRLSALHGGRYIARGTKAYSSQKTIKYKEFKVHPLFDDYYRRLIELCIENGIQVRLVKLPLADNEIFTDNYKEEFQNYYEQLKKDYPEITVDWIPAYRQEYFADKNHMNSHGALKFSRELKERYQEDFTKEISAGQIEAVNDSIAEENSVEQIIRWASGKDYTILFYDGTGKFSSLYKTELENSSYFWQKIKLKSSDIYCAYGISGNGENGKEVFVHEKDRKVIVELGGEDGKVWKRPDENGLKVIVIDNYNGQVICEKIFKYDREVFDLVW